MEYHYLLSDFCFNFYHFHGLLTLNEKTLLALSSYVYLKSQF